MSISWAAAQDVISDLRFRGGDSADAGCGKTAPNRRMSIKSEDTWKIMIHDRAGKELTMPRTWTKTDAFAHFGTTLTNARWSWSGIALDGSVVALVLWQDVVKGRDGRLTYFDDEDLDAEWRRRPGHTERVRHLAICRDRHDGRFRAVIARAVDVTADPRDIASCHPQEGVWWRLDEFDEATGAFCAHVER